MGERWICTSSTSHQKGSYVGNGMTLFENDTETIYCWWNENWSLNVNFMSTNREQRRKNGWDVTVARPIHLMSTVFWSITNFSMRKVIKFWLTGKSVLLSFFPVKFNMFKRNFAAVIRFYPRENWCDTAYVTSTLERTLLCPRVRLLQVTFIFHILFPVAIMT